MDNSDPSNSKPVMVQFTTKMSIDADGAGSAYKSDPDGKPATALNYSDGSSLDPTRIPYVVLPPDFMKAHPTVKLGDYVAVSYKDPATSTVKTTSAIVGDVGPAGVIGECSMACAKSLGIPNSPTKGGVSNGVTYSVYPGTASHPLPTNAHQIRSTGLALAGLVPSGS